MKDLTFFSAARLSDAQQSAWREFAASVPWAHYMQDPAWALTASAGGGSSLRRPVFFWAERQGSVCLTAIGIRRRLPVPGHVFWEFNYGPVFQDAAVFDSWLAWLPGHLGRSAARVRVQPPMPLGEGGDDIETMLEGRGYARQRLYGGWTTLLLDISGDESLIMKSFRDATRRAIKKSRNVGVVVGAEDGPVGWQAIADLQTELGRHAPVPPLDAQTAGLISKAWLRQGEGGTVLVARHDGDPVAAALVVTYRGTAHLPIIPSRRGGDVPASHLLVWESIDWARKHGCTALDFVGYGMTARPGDPMSGINQFKRGFCPLDSMVRTVAMHEIVLSPAVVAMAGAARSSQTHLKGAALSSRKALTERRARSVGRAAPPGAAREE